MINRQWRLADKNNHYYHQSHNGLIVGHAYNVVHTIVWGAKIPINAAEELILGQYVELEHAKRAIEEFWEGKDRTLEVVHEHLLSKS